MKAEKLTKLILCCLLAVGFGACLAGQEDLDSQWAVEGEPAAVEAEGAAELALTYISPERIKAISAEIRELAASGETEIPYDFEREIDLVDSDGDSFPDITEQLDGTDPFDAASVAGIEGFQAKAGGFPTPTCRPGFQNAGSRLCISRNVQNATAYRHASRLCRGKRSHVCTYEDLTYLYYTTALDATYNPLNKWIGNMVADDRVFYGNKSITFNNDPDITNFEGVSSKNSSRAYWCCHDDE